MEFTTSARICRPRSVSFGGLAGRLAILAFDHDATTSARDASQADQLL
jgi:hypothetical protein